MIPLLTLTAAAAAVAIGAPGVSAQQLIDQPTVSHSPSVVASGVQSAQCTLPLGDAKRDESDGALVLLLDGTLSSVEQPGRTDDLLAVLDAATAGRRLTVSVGSFGGTDADVHYERCLDGVEFVATGNNARTRERNRHQLLDETAELLAATPAGYTSSDPVAALRAGVRRLGEAVPVGAAVTADGNDGDGPVRLLVLHTDGIPTAGCAALPAEVDVSSPTLIDELVWRCVDSGQLPDATGVDVVIGGVARTDQTLGNDVVTFLLDLNRALCDATGASCRVDPNFPTAL